MFEVGFTEIVLILGLALLVLGPEKLPALAEKVGRWTGRARAMARQLRTQLEQEVTLEEMTKSRPASPPPSYDSTDSAAAATSPSPSSEAGPAETPAASFATSEPSPAMEDRPHSPAGLDVSTMVSGIEPQPAATNEPGIAATASQTDAAKTLQ